MNITERCRKPRLWWFGHLKRPDQDYVGRMTLEMVPPGRRKRGRPKQRWMDCVNRDTRATRTNKKMKSMTYLAGGGLCLPQRSHNQVGAARRRSLLYMTVAYHKGAPRYSTRRKGISARQCIYCGYSYCH